MKYVYKPDPLHGVFVGFGQRKRARTLLRIVLAVVLAVVLYGSLSVGVARLLAWILWGGV